MRSEVRFDEIGYWSEVKLDIISEFASAYSKILTAQRRMMPRLRHLYIDGFAGAGVHISRTTGDFVLRSPLNALLVEPPFHEFHLVDLQKGRAAHLRSLIGDRRNEAQLRSLGFRVLIVWECRLRSVHLEAIIDEITSEIS